MSLPYVTLSYITWHDMTLHTYLCIPEYISCINIHWIDINFRDYGSSDAIIQWWYTNNLEQKGKVLQYYARGLMKNPKWPSKSMTMARIVWIFTKTMRSNGVSKPIFCYVKTWEIHKKYRKQKSQQFAWENDEIPIDIIWLVVSFNPSEGYEFVTWDSSSQWKVIIQPCSKPPTRYILPWLSIINHY